MKKSQLIGIRNKQNISDKEMEGRWREKGFILTVRQYNALLLKQNFCCAICYLHKGLFKHGLGVDHDHYSGEVRGLLCVNCNALIGHAKYRIDTLEKAIAYLSREISLESIVGEI